MDALIVGIDLGTTNSEIAVWQDGKVVLMEGENGPILPSYVGLNKDGQILVGAPAQNQYTLYPEQTVKSVKRLMGSGETVQLGDQSYRPQEISAIIIRQLKQWAEASLGTTVEKAVITVPAFFSDAQRQATREAGEIAGLQVVKMINEPTAATLVYESGSRGSRNVLVYDLGGGTFDVSVVRMEDDVIEVVASHGNNTLGGDDFDARLVDHVVEFLAREHKVSDLPPAAMARIVRAAEAAKRQLSSAPFATIREEYLLEQDTIPLHMELEISRHAYEEMIRPYIDETMEAVHLVLKDAGMVASEIDEILLVGGSTRTPLVQQRLEEDFGKPPRGEVDPDLCVASGAAMQAAMIAGSEVQAVLVDVTPYTFGTSAIGEVGGEFSLEMYVPLIKKNTPIPVTKSDVFYTAVDDQEAVRVVVYQGENENAPDNIEVGSFMVEGLRKGPAGQEIIATFSLDSNGILQVSAKEKATGLEKKITIENVLSDFTDEALEQARKRISELFGDTAGEGAAPDEKNNGKERPAEIDRAEELVSRAQNLLDDATDDDRDDLVDLIESVTSAIASADTGQLRSATEELADLLFYLES